MSVPRKQVRNLVISVVVNKKEYDAIAKAARKRGLSMSAYAREKALDLQPYVARALVHGRGRGVGAGGVWSAAEGR